MAEKRSNDEELARFRAEAEGLIRAKDPDATMPNGARAFAR
jgi:hypothetical protein